MASGSRKRINKKMGKAQAREQFAPLVESLSTTGGIVEVTDYGKVSAVIIGHKDYLLLLAQANKPLRPRRQLSGSAELVGNIEAASNEIADSIRQSIEKSEREL